jgi:hypothetical protein
MKKVQLLILALLLAVPVSGYAQSAVYGDVNGDGEVTISDVNEVINVILGNYQPVDILGSWISEYGVDGYGKYDISESDAVSFDFYGDKTGRYYCYYNNVLSYIGLRWELQGHRLYIWYDDGDHEKLYYRIDEDGYLLLALDENYSIYTGYRRVNGSDILATADAKKYSSQSNSGVVIKSVSRAIKVRVNTED